MAGRPAGEEAADRYGGECDGALALVSSKDGWGGGARPANARGRSTVPQRDRGTRRALTWTRADRFELRGVAGGGDET